MRTTIHTTHHATPKQLTAATSPIAGINKRPSRLRPRRQTSAHRPPEPCPLSQPELRAIVLEIMG